MKRLAIVLFLLLSAVWGFAQEPLSGIVVDDAGKALAGANVMAYGAGGKVLSFAVTGTDGTFQLKKTAGLERITASFMGFKTVSIPAGQFKDGQQIRMEAGGFQLKEVAVTAERIKENGDTLTYSVGGFKQAQDRSIADVIGKMPGLEVKASGAIEYQGKPINKFYIEGMDLMGSQYALASENLSADKVKEVQVLENHQAIKSLRDVSFSEQAAINLVLKDEAKSTWSALADLGGGYGKEWLYDNRLMGMQFNKHFQTLMLYKNNNTGKDIGAEVVDLTDLTGYRMENGLLDMISLSGPEFERERYTFNSSHLLAGNWLLKTGPDSQLRLQASGLLDREHQQSCSRTTYLTIAGMPVVVEDWDVAGRRREVKGEVEYTLNSAKTYLNSRTKVYADWNASSGVMNLDGNATDLMVRPWKRSGSEDLSMSHTTKDGHIWRLFSSTGYTWLPGQLLTLDGKQETLDLGLFSTRNYVSVSHRIGKWILSGKMGMDARRQQINDHLWSLLMPYVEPALQREFGSHKLDGLLRISYQRRQYDQNVQQGFCFEPTVRWNWKLSPTSSMLVYYRLSASPMQGTKVVDAPVYTSYRSQYVGTGIPDVQLSHTVSGTYSYRNPVYGLFFSINPVFTRSKGNLLYANTIDSGIYVQQASGRTYDANTYLLDGRISKSFSWCRTVIGLSGSALLSDYSYLSAGKVVDARTAGYTVSLDYSLRPARWMTMEGGSLLEMTRRSVEGAAMAGVNDWEHRMQLNFLPAKRWMISLHNELYHSSEKDFGVNWFCDASVSYKADRWEVSLVGRNLAGISCYERIRVSSTLQSYTMTHLRPREMLVRFCLDL